MEFSKNLKFIYVKTNPKRNLDLPQNQINGGDRVGSNQGQFFCQVSLKRMYSVYEDQPTVGSIPK